MRMAWRSTPRDDMSRNAVAFAATTFAFVAMQSIFSMYYVDLFLNVYGVSSWWFYVSQALYLVWNAVNDPLFGWIQDMSSSPGRRQQAILHGAPLFAASFLVPWFDMGAGSELLTGLHMVFALCFWDCMFTYVVLAQCALFAEISPNLEDRTRVLQYSQVASMLGSCSVFVAHVLWDKSNLLPFRVMCVVVAVVAYLCFRYTGLHARTHPHFRPSEPAEGAKNGEKSGDLADGSLRNFLKLTMQIVRQRNFQLFVGMNFLQIFHSTFASSFYTIFEDSLLGSPFDSSARAVRSVIAGASGSIPQLAVLFLSPLLPTMGSYALIRYSFILKVFLGGLFLLAAQSLGASAPLSAAIILGYMVVNRAIAEGTFALFNLSLADIIDADVVGSRRSAPISSMFFGTNALFTKPAQSLSPMFVLAVLASKGYVGSGAAQDALAAAPGSHVDPAGEPLRAAMLLLLGAIPVVCGIFQFVLWSGYGLRSSHRSKQTSLLAAAQTELMDV